jgi:ParB-like chromosome segregation protein Spo0J
MLRARNELQIHPEAEIIPPMQAEEYRALVDDIREHGIKVPLDVSGNNVLDGRHRLRAAEELDLGTVPVREVPLDGESAGEYIVRSAVLRRHLTDDQRAVMAARWALAHPEHSTSTPGGRS